VNLIGRAILKGLDIDLPTNSFANRATCPVRILEQLPGVDWSGWSGLWRTLRTAGHRSMS
jgi:hypothetical protein